MNILRAVLNRAFGVRKPRRSPQYEYIPDHALPDTAAELTRVGVVEAWRTDHFGTAWFRAEPDAIQWYIDYLGGPIDAD